MMTDLTSMLIGSALSIGASIAASLYQNWKKETFERVRIFLQAQRQININSCILDQSKPDSKISELPLSKVKFLPPYPYADFYLLDDDFQSICMAYESALSSLLSGKTDINTFNAQSRIAMSGIQGLLTLWNDYLRRYLLLFFLLPPLLKQIMENQIAEQHRRREKH